MTDEAAFRVPALAGFADGRRELERRAPHLRALYADESSTLSEELFAGLEFPALAKLTLLPGSPLEGAGGVFARFFRLEDLSFWASTRGRCEVGFPLLAAAPFWERLTHLEMMFLLEATQENLSADAGWADLWVGRELSLERMKISGAKFPAVETLLRAHLPRLRSLSLAAALPEAILDAVANAGLPALETLDVRFNMISEDGLRSFARTARKHLPALREVGIEMYTGERVDYHDWNGALVGGYDVQYAPEELERMCLEGTGISVMREAPAW